MARQKRPPKALRDGLTKLFERHDWPGMPAGLIPVEKETVGAGTDNCPPGTSPHVITYQDDKGRWITTTVCV